MANRKRKESSDWFFDTFEPRADNFDKNFKRTQRAVFAVWAVCFVASSSLAIGIIWVAWHFVSKFW